MIPDQPVTECVLCAIRANTYDPECRACYIRETARMPFAHKAQRYSSLAKASPLAADKLANEVAGYHKAHSKHGAWA